MGIFGGYLSLPEVFIFFPKRLCVLGRFFGGRERFLTCCGFTESLLRSAIKIPWDGRYLPNIWLKILGIYIYSITRFICMVDI